MSREASPIHLILPMQPTPDGRLHIGHAAGPYLRADALARRLRRDGEIAVVATGPDAYENWVLMEARHAGEDPHETCRRMTAGIRQDLTHLGVEPDIWIDPMSDGDRADYIALHEQFLRELSDRGRATLSPEHVPASQGTGEYLTGPWISGLCPECDKPVAGNSCVACGGSFQPSEVVEPRSRFDGSGIDWVAKDSWFAEAPSKEAVLAVLRSAGVAEAFIDIAARHMSRAGLRARLSQPSSWGMRSRMVDPDCVLSNSYYLYCLFCGARAAARLGEPANLLARSSRATVVALFGKDNAGAGLVVASTLALNSDAFRGFDAIAVNHLLHFDGSKCSKSRKHGILVSQLVEETSVSSDELRFALAQAPLEHEPHDLQTNEIISTINDLRRWRVERLAPLLAGAGDTPDRAVCAQARDVIAAQASVLEPRRLHLAEATSLLKSWMTDTRFEDSPGARRAWLQAFALLAEPVAPQLAGAVWRSLGLTGRPTTSALSDPGEVTKLEADAPLPLHPSELEPVARRAAV
ncbi:MAG: class I tRNA ligase family protein [Phenylobacterium sp.]|uniref:class I tRNA ligase family protein n=1 Tax=Phenylobacterium sp. TaxID=1871053 RepID=UPI002735AD94|nr:class I tRNA ligase family protein [Phenylobacterium sp.]MDP3745645.1 class I tRNA ligase family protein [Phenylobacterium sp.]